MNIELNDECKRVTWRLDSKLHRKLTILAKSSKLSLEEVGNIVMADVNWDDVKKRVVEHQRAKKQSESARKRATEALAGVDPKLLDRLADLTAEDIAKVLGK